MQLKDYYKTLGVQPSDSMLQIKKSFRQLALKYHPDKNPGSVSAEANFKEIQEAYETLIDSGKREEYNYKRWYNRSINEPFIKESLTPAAILNECSHFNQYMQQVNTLRVDFDALSHRIRQLLSDKNIGILLQFNEQDINKKIIEKIIPPAGILPFQYTPPIVQLLMRVAGNNEALMTEVQNFARQQQKKDNWQRYRWLLVTGITLLLCWIIYLISK